MTGSVCVTNSPVWQALQDAVKGLPGSTQWEQFLDDLFDELDQMRVEYTQRLRDLEQDRQRLAESEEKLLEQREAAQHYVRDLEHTEAELSEALTELESIRAELSGSEGPGDLREKLSETQTQRDTLRLELETARGELARLTGSAVEVQELRRVLDDAEHGLVGEDLVQLEQERDELADELELVRTRAASLEDTVNNQQREMNEQRAALTTEMKELRQMLERQPDVYARGPSGEAAVTPGGARRVPQETGAPGDPVVSSVMAQFAKLQKDVAQRRRRKA